MADTFISFYLRQNRIHVFLDSLRGIGSPSRICFMTNETGDSLVLSPYDKRDLKSHNVPDKVYNGTSGLEINSYKLCHLLAGLHHWDINRSYRVPGTIISSKKIVAFRLSDAQVIEK